MITFAKLRIMFTVNIVSTCCYDDWKNGAERTLVCSRKTWNLTSLTTDEVFLNYIMCDGVFSFMNITI